MVTSENLYHSKAPSRATNIPDKWKTERGEWLDNNPMGPKTAKKSSCTNISLKPWMSLYLSDGVFHPKSKSSLIVIEATQFKVVFI